MRFRQLGEKRDCLRGSYLFHYFYRTRLSGRCYPSECNAKYTCNGCYNAPYHRNRACVFRDKNEEGMAFSMLSRLTRISNLRIGFLVGVYRLTTGEVIYVPENATE